MNELPFDRPATPVSSQNIDPALIQQMLVALTNLQIQSQERLHSIPRDPKVPDVPTFNGNKLGYNVFLAKLSNFFKMQPQSYNSDDKKIGYVISRLEGTAADWAVTLLENPQNGNNSNILNNWNHFLEAFNRFSDPHAKRNATDSLLSLSQGKSQSVLAYWTKFSDLLYRSDISPDSARPLFERGLRYEIRERLVDKDLPSELDSYVMAVVDLDNRLFRLRQEKRLFQSKSLGSSAQGNFFPQTSSNGPTPMEIGNLDVNDAEVLVNGVKLSNSVERLNEIRRMAPEDRREVCFQEHRCHYCKRVVGSPPAHVAQNCPLKKNKSKSDYLQEFPEVHPQKGIPDSAHIDGIPQRQDLYINVINERVKDNSLLVKQGELIVGIRKSKVEIMLDSGAMGMGYIDRKYAQKLGFELKKLERAIQVKTIDGSNCGTGRIECSIRGRVCFDGFLDELELLVIDSPRHHIILGHTWFQIYNPIINWEEGTVVFGKAQERLSNGVPACPSEGIPRRQVVFDLPHDFETKSLVEVNALLEMLEDEEDIMIGFLDHYSAVGEQSMELGRLPDVVADYADVFSSSEFPNLPPHREGIDLEIELQDGKAPPFGPIYSLSVNEELVLKKYLEGAEAAGIIRKSRSPAGAPVMFVKKSDGTLRLCVDYRGLNGVTKTNRAALPIIRDMLFRAREARYFSKIDLKNAFNLVRIAAGQEYLTAFRTKYGHYEYLVMPFGLKNAPGHFQSFMNSVFSNLIDRGVLVFIDDLLLYSDTKEEHDCLIKEVFDRLRANQLKANPKKCTFYQSEVHFLGHKISQKGVEMDSSKLDSIKNWKIPGNVKELQSFLGLCNYYRDFIPQFAETACPLYKLTKKGQQYIWDGESQKAFNSLKSMFSSNYVLIQPDPTKQFYLECDASDFALGAVLSQLDGNGQLRPIGFYSRKFAPAELNYEIYDKELLAIIDGFRNWRHYCIGTETPVIVYTDHNNLKYFMSSRKLNRRQARWSLFLADYNFLLTVRPGNQQLVSDSLSRQEQYLLKETDHQENQQILLPTDKFDMKGRSSDFSLRDSNDRLDYGLHLNALDESEEDPDNESTSEFDATHYHSETDENSEFDEDNVSAIGDTSQFMEFDGQTPSSDPLWFQYLLQYLWSGELPLVISSDLLKKVLKSRKKFKFKNDRLYFSTFKNGREYDVPYIPCVERVTLMRKYHLTLGHMATATLLPLLTVRYYWPDMAKDIFHFTKNCRVCQLNSNDITERRPLQPHEPVGIPFLKWGIDFLQDLPENSEGYTNIFTAKCYATKLLILVPTRSRSAQVAAQCIFEHIVCKFGVPLEIVSDRASAFLDQVLQEYLKILEIHHLPTSAYTPRSNGNLERAHRDVNSILTKLCQGEPHKWTHYVSQVEFILNSRIHSVTGFSPFYLAHGVDPRIPGDEVPPIPPRAYDLNNPEDVAALSSRELAALGQNRAAALQRLKEQASWMKSSYDERLGVQESRFQVGDVVKMKNHHRTKFKFKYLGPFYIVAKGMNGTFYLQRPDGRRWVDVTGTDTPVNPDHLAKFTEFDGEFYYDGRSIREVEDSSSV